MPDSWCLALLDETDGVETVNFAAQPLDRGIGEAMHIGVEDGAKSQESFLLNGSPDPKPLPRWFALYTASRHEKRVAQHLDQRAIEHYLPLYRSQRKWSDGSKVTLDLPLFPGYLFVRIQRNERVKVLEVPGALTVVGRTGREPVPLAEEVIEALRTGLEQRRAEPHALLTMGQRARIRSGALVGMEGVVQRVKNGFRVVLTLEHIQRSIAVEVDAEDLEPVSGEDPIRFR